MGAGGRVGGDQKVEEVRAVEEVLGVEEKAQEVEEV